MNKDNKNKFTEALKLFDNKDYKLCKKECIKILEKTPIYPDVLALKGITITHLGEKEQGLKDIKEAIKQKFSNPIPWHFMALYYKEEKDYAQAMRNYTMALKHDSGNFNILREQAFLQLYLRLYESFFESSKKALEMRSSLVLNWVSYSLSAYLIKNYEFAEKILNSTLKVIPENTKANEKHELKQFNALLLVKQQKRKEAILYLNENKDDFIDKTKFNEDLFKYRYLEGDYSSAAENIEYLINLNNENRDYILWGIKLLCLTEGTISEYHQTIKSVKTFDDFVHICDSNASIQKIIIEKFNLLSEKHQLSKSKVSQMIRFALADIAEFESLLDAYIKNAIFTCHPTIFSSIKWIYNISDSKLKVVFALIDKLSNEFNSHKTVYGSDLVPHISWYHFFIASHFKKLNQPLEAITHINKAIDLTPTVIDFFTLKSKILERCFHFKEAERAYNKARLLDVGDRFLNAKHGKVCLRAEDMNLSFKIMKEFVKEPLLDENIEHIQCCWYILESANYFLRNGEIPHAERLVLSILSIFQQTFEDQYDFYGYCLRRNCVFSFLETLEYLDRVFDHSNIYKSLEMINYIYDALCVLEVSQDRDLKEKAFIELNETAFKETKYKFKSFSESKKNLVDAVNNVLLKIQPYSKKEALHYICVKFSLLKNKPLYALKSLKFLNENCKESNFTLSSLNLFSSYMMNNSDIKANSLYMSIIIETISELEVPENIFNNTKKTLIEHSEALLGLNSKELSTNLTKNISLLNFNHKETTLKTVLDSIQSRGFDDLKYINFKTYNRLIIFARLFISKDYTEKFISEVKSKFTNISHPSISTYNLDLYDIFNEEKKPKYTE